MPWVATDRVEHIVDTPMELLKASGGILYVGDIARYSKTSKTALLSCWKSRPHVRVIASCGFKRGESADDVVAGRLAELLKERIDVLLVQPAGRYRLF